MSSSVPPATSGRSAAPDLLELLSRVNCHVYSGEIGADGEYVELFTGPGTELLLGGPIPPGVDPTDAWHSAVHPEDWGVYLDAGARLETDAMVSFEYRLIGRDRVTRWVLDRMWLRERVSDDRRIVDGVITDVTELHERAEQVQEALQAVQYVNEQLEQARLDVEEATAWLEAAVDTSPAAMIMLDTEARVRLWNPAAERMFGWTQAAVIGKVAPHVPPDRREAFLELLRQVTEGDALVEHEEERIGRDGVRRQVAISTAVMREPSGEISGFLGMLTDISQRKVMEDRLRDLAHRDSLTGLANRVRIMERVDETVAQLEGTERSVALLLLDLDGFKAVNDSFGHAVGDELLVAVAGRLLSCLRSHDLAARLGGDEFAILLEPVDGQEAVRVAERILEVLAQPIDLRRAQVVVTASIGIAHGNGQRSTQDLLRDADVAMYMAKGQGKNRLVVFHPSMQERVATRLRLESELRRAVEREEFELHYQPIVNLDTQRIIGVEALVRWRHPERGLLLPADFISVAEETGLIVPIGRWILTQACAQAANWQVLDPAQLVSIGVNLSPRQLHDAGLVEVAASALSVAQLPAAALTIEITENLLLGDSSLAEARLAQLRAMGIRVAVDDFGTGYSSLAYLRRLPVDTLKIDRSFVAPLSDGPRPAALVRSIIDLAAALDLDTVAEGVENAEQAAILNSLGCHVAQGYYFGYPQPPDGITRLIHSGTLGLPRARNR
jgi:diguanylate cyclase (GGDEF)-like protein/PAS domain S-box-containing protein